LPPSRFCHPPRRVLKAPTVQWLPILFPRPDLTRQVSLLKELVVEFHRLSPAIPQTVFRASLSFFSKEGLGFYRVPVYWVRPPSFSLGCHCKVIRFHRECSLGTNPVFQPPRPWLFLLRIGIIRVEKRFCPGALPPPSLFSQYCVCLSASPSFCAVPPLWNEIGYRGCPHVVIHLFSHSKQVS